jgi:two-component system sensor histidine kinase PilS (NtrC family)
VNSQRSEIAAEIERRRTELSLGLLKIYNYYRIFIGLALLVAYQQTLVSSKLGSLDPALFLWGCLAYTLLNTGIAILIRVLPQSWFNHQSSSLGLVVFDTLGLTVLMYSSGGIDSGLGALVMITVITGAILVNRQRATLIAATATIAVLYQEFYLALAQPAVEYDFFQAGVFGAIYFSASLAIQSLSNRIRSNDIRALTQAVELADLERLNRQIIQRMRTGIIVVDPNDAIRMHNQSARALIGNHSSERLEQLPQLLQDALQAWREDANHRALPFQIGPHTPEIRVNFSAVRNTEDGGDVTIYIEDTGEIQQQAQQLKLAELGRLSASIAHEVRNPLGAISHAAQLLVESEELQPADQRLTDIIINHCHRMNGVVENVLEMSRRRAPEPERLNLRDHLKEFVSAFTESRPSAELTIAVEPDDAEIRVDYRQLNQALTNLADNGIRYSEENGNGPRVLLQGGIEESTGRPFLNVIDYGAGVEPVHESKLFQPFSTTARKGTGLGLYLARELCESNQAQLSYSRHAEGGSCFRILFSHPDRITA